MYAYAGASAADASSLCYLRVWRFQSGESALPLPTDQEHHFCKAESLARFTVAASSLLGFSHFFPPDSPCMQRLPFSLRRSCLVKRQPAHACQCRACTTPPVSALIAPFSINCKLHLLYLLEQSSVFFCRGGPTLQVRPGNNDYWHIRKTSEDRTCGSAVVLYLA